MRGGRRTWVRVGRGDEAGLGSGDVSDRNFVHDVRTRV